jgi:hypothetical protein
MKSIMMLDFYRLILDIINKKRNGHELKTIRNLTRHTGNDATN